MSTDSMLPQESHRYQAHHGLTIGRTSLQIEIDAAIEPLIDALDSHRGALFTSTYEYPGRYTRWDMGFRDPALEIVAVGRDMRIRALSARGEVPLAAIESRCEAMTDAGSLNGFEFVPRQLDLRVNQPTQRFSEEQRSRQPSVFSVLREIIDLFRSDEDSHLGLYGAFGYDLAFQFEPVVEHMPRPGDHRDLLLYIPDELTIVDRKREVAMRHRYDFVWNGRSTSGMPYGEGEVTSFRARPGVEPTSDHEPGEYAEVVIKAKEYFKRGDLFEVVPGQVFTESPTAPPSELFRRLRERNPAPYGALINLGESEYLVAASPEMYVRVEGRRVETCPIAGTIERGKDVLADAENIRTLLNSSKDESELTMCTDIDRNDKSRVCDPESIRVIGRRQIETYSRLFHTVDHVEGTLLPQFDGLDAFLAHTWAVTVTGAPKLWAMRYIEEHEKSPRAWYGGAIGALTFNGAVNTGLTLRTIQVKDGLASVRAGATLLMDSDPDAEERETCTKASAMLDAIRRGPDVPAAHAGSHISRVGDGVRVLLIDHEDSFVHTLAGYLRRTGAEVTTVRVSAGGHLDLAELSTVDPHLVVISPGPGRPSDFNLSETLSAVLARNVAVFGVCLGLQGIVEHFGGTLDTLAYPSHGRTVQVKALSNASLFDGLPQDFTAGLYHSLFADKQALPDALRYTAESQDGVIMAVQHTTLAVSAVQFHPESMMTMKGEVGMQLIENVIRQVAATPQTGPRLPKLQPGAR